MIYCFFTVLLGLLVLKKVFQKVQSRGTEVSLILKKSGNRLWTLNTKLQLHLQRQEYANLGCLWFTEI